MDLIFRLLYSNLILLRDDKSLFYPEIDNLCLFGSDPVYCPVFILMKFYKVHPLTFSEYMTALILEQQS